MGSEVRNWRVAKTRRATSWDSPATRGNLSELWAKGRPGGVRDQKLGRARDHGERHSPVSGRERSERARTTANDTARGQRHGERFSAYGSEARSNARVREGRNTGNSTKTETAWIQSDGFIANG